MAGQQPELSGLEHDLPRHTADIVLRVQPRPDGDDAELASLTQRLRTQLLDLDVDAVDPVADTSQPAGAKGLETLIGWLAVRLGRETLRTVIGGVVDWATRTNNTVEITYQNKSLKVSRATAAQQERLINDFLTHYPPRP